MIDRLPSKQIYEVSLHTRRDTYEWVASAPAFVDYDRVVGIHVDSIGAAESLGDISDSNITRHFRMTGAMVNGLRIAMDRIAKVDTINCNLFSRLLHPDYIDLALMNPSGESWYPIDRYSSRRELARTLGMGAVGVVRLGNRGSVHSLVGLDETSDLSIQVMSHGGELAVLSNQELLNFYQRLNPETSAKLYEVS